MRKRSNLFFLLFLPAAPLAIFLLAILLIRVPLPGLPAPMSQARNLTAAVTAGVLGLCYIIAVGWFVTGLFRGYGRILDTTLQEQGFRVSNYLFFGRLYQGKIQGVCVSLSVLPPTWRKPFQLNLRVARAGEQPGDGRHWLAITRRCIGTGITASRHRDSLVGSFLGKQGVKRVVRRLLEDPRAGNATLYVRASCLWFYCHVSAKTNPSAVTEWLKSMIGLAHSLGP